MLNYRKAGRLLRKEGERAALKLMELVLNAMSVLNFHDPSPVQCPFLFCPAQGQIPVLLITQYGPKVGPKLPVASSSGVAGLELKNR